jgi:geranylgeranyl pyrophosphate synthase
MSTVEATPFEEVIAAGGPGIRRLMDEVEALLAEVASGYGDVLARPAGTTLAAGGKRLRPLLVFICGEGGEDSPDRKSLVRAGAAVELVHMATLVHDDVVDSASVRRGQPTVFAVSGRRTATATGDFLFSRALSLLDGDTRLEQVQTLAGACLALARGELVQREDAYKRRVDAARYLQRCELKTASLFAAACKLGSLAGGGRGRTVALERFGHRVGLAFQLLDDVLDVVGSPGDTGKPRGSDLLDGAVTLPLILASKSDPELRELDLGSISSREDAERVCDRIAATDALTVTRKRANELVSEAKADLDGSLPAESTALLHLVADRIVDRYS